MPIKNTEIAALFNYTADLLEVDDANPFRVRAYRNAARQIESMAVPLATLVATGEDLKELPAIGDDLAGKIVELVNTGHCRALEDIQQHIPGRVSDLLHIPGLGPKRVRTLYRELNIQSMEQLARAIRDGRVGLLPGFGAKTESAILKGIEEQLNRPDRIKLTTATPIAQALKTYLQSLPSVQQVTIAGSFRRCRETVGDLDILVVATDASVVMQGFVTYNDVDKVVSKGSTRGTVILHSGLQVDVRIVSGESYGAALQYFTGAKAHSIELRRLAQRKGLKLNEYGVFRGQKKIAGTTEKSVYRALRLPWIPPELRENRGELEAAKAGKLPKLIELTDLKGDLHAHTKATDGHHSLREMAEAARQRGLTYLAITEHSRHLTVAKGLDSQRLRRQLHAIDKLNDELQGITLLKSIEVDILDDGRLDLPDDVLAELDLVVGAVHSKLHLSREKQTQRILRAMENPYFTILAHPTGRLLQTREPYDVDMEKILNQARQTGCYIELNAHPDRLDLIDVHCQMAKAQGVLIAISSDAHWTQDFDNLVYGISQARRGWLEAENVLNTRTLKQLRPLLNRHNKAPNEKHIKTLVPENDKV